MVQTKTEADAVLADVKAALDLGSLNPSQKWIKQSFWDVENQLTFRRGAVGYPICYTVGYLCSYGYYERAADAAVVLGRIDPMTWNIDYMYIRTPMETAYFFALRAGDYDRAKLIRPWLGRPARVYREHAQKQYFPTARIMEGRTLKLPFDDPHYGKDMPGRPENWIADDAISDLSDLALIWNYGGSALWPRERIMNQVDTTIPMIHALDGWGPW